MKNRNMGIVRFLILGVVCSFFSAACEPEFARLDFTIISQPNEQEIVISNDSIELPAGSAVIIEAEPVSDSLEDFAGSADVELICEDEEILEIRHSIRSRELVLIGITAGETNVAIEINGKVEGHIPVLVTSN
jgi:hypothetical protein